jgi:hypothetical protein
MAASVQRLRPKQKPQDQSQRKAENDRKNNQKRGFPPAPGISHTGFDCQDKQNQKHTIDNQNLDEIGNGHLRLDAMIPKKARPAKAELARKTGNL